jgi:hypothetical protein
MRVNELALSQAVLPSLAKVGIHEVEQLAEHRTGELLRRPELSSGAGERWDQRVGSRLQADLAQGARGFGVVPGDRERIDVQANSECFCLASDSFDRCLDGYMPCGRCSWVGA